MEFLHILVGKGRSSEKGTSICRHSLFVSVVKCSLCLVIFKTSPPPEMNSLLSPGI